MVKQYQKGVEFPLSTHFNSSSFDCHCRRSECGITLVSEELVESLELLYDISGRFTISSGFRCYSHNLEIGGAKASQHTLGIAADIKSCSGYTGNLMRQYAERIDAFDNGGIGIADKWVHLDVRGVRARWTYPIVC